MDPLLCVDNITICYNQKPIVENASFSLEKGKTLGIIGESGAGKSTILKAVIGLLGQEGMITEGNIWYRGKNMTDMSLKERRKLLGKEIGMVFQDCKSFLCPIRTIGSQIYESMAAHEKISKKEAYERASFLMQTIGLEDSKRIWNSYPFELSGGMNQRVGICMAVLLKPSLLLADEPTSSLDAATQAQVIKELQILRKKEEMAMILVTHNIGVVSELANEILVLKAGKLENRKRQDIDE